MFDPNIHISDLILGGGFLITYLYRANRVPDIEKKLDSVTREFSEKIDKLVGSMGELSTRMGSLQGSFETYKELKNGVMQK